VAHFSYVPSSAPFVEAAKHFSSSESAEPEVAFSSPKASVPFSGVAEHFYTPAEDEPEIPVWSLNVSEPFAEAPTQASSLEDAEPAVSALTPVVPVVADSDWLWAVPEVQPVKEVAASTPVTEPTAPQMREPVQPAANPDSANSDSANRDSDVPWWLSVTSRRPEPTRPPVLWQPARVWMSRKPDAVPAPWTVAPTVNPEPAPRAAATAGQHVSGGYNTPRAEAMSQEMQKSEVDEAPVTLSSRLSGLRNLLFVLGVKDPHGAEEKPERPAGSGSDFDLRNERTAADRAMAEDAANSAPISIGGASPRLVTAPPEFLPPKAIVVNVDREDGHAGESATRQDRRAAYDGIEILPSRRGQYKRI
jgi:hypothetical protein